MLLNLSEIKLAERDLVAWKVVLQQEKYKFDWTGAHRVTTYHSSSDPLTRSRQPGFASNGRSMIYEIGKITTFRPPGCYLFKYRKDARAWMQELNRIWKGSMSGKFFMLRVIIPWSSSYRTGLTHEAEAPAYVAKTVRIEGWASGRAPGETRK